MKYLPLIWSGIWRKRGRSTLIMPRCAPSALDRRSGCVVLFNGNVITPAGMSIMLAITPGVVTLGIAWALAMGLLGGLLPALRAASASVTAALRAI